ncbi:carbohydrate ABC transporter permease [Clostridium estertheticum]|uniref:carbohydrate ABC transporter permease n=1 Tax=Clostridium estertheticum TaxID=238834 RepID=UPI001CF2AA8A|nr:sugar ABC transporter permease [Clostridium estertheticum]MCB2356045.1 sugar ABC transporter permease [Clostridium estertheticum]WAG42174.1 sugar ABC transporter permease [Clostridium estertheticum]
MSEIISAKKEVIKLESKETRIGLKRKLEPYAFLFPSLLLFGLFVYYPFLKTLYMSFSLTNAHGGFQEFIGIQNYVEIFTSADFINSLVVTMKFVVITTIPSVIIGLFLALLANNKVKGIGISKVMFAVPIAVSSASASIIWGIIFHPSIGMLNNILKTSIGWLIDPHWALFSVAFVTIWMNIGVNFIFILAGLKNVPKEILESSSIDGARYFRKLFKIIIPMISPTLFFMVFMDIMNAFQSFGQVNILTNGGPGNSTNVLVFSIYREAFFNGRFDTASAQSIILFILMFVIAMFQFSYEKKGVHYS